MANVTLPDVDRHAVSWAVRYCLFFYNDSCYELFTPLKITSVLVVAIVVVVDVGVVGRPSSTLPNP